MEPEITVREDAPEGLRFAILLIAEDVGMRPGTMRRTICAVLLVRPDPSNWSEYPNIWDEVNGLIVDSQWFKVYDIAEAIHATLAAQSSDEADIFQDRLNGYFRDNGIGWQMTGGRIVYRGSEVFTETTREAAAVLAQAGRSVLPRMRFMRPFATFRGGPCLM